MAEKKKVVIKHGGLGDDVENILTKTGVKKLIDIFVDGKDCGCDKRKEVLNNLLPKRFTARCFTEEEYNTWKGFREVRTLILTPTQSNMLVNLYASVFNVPVFQPCVSCSPKPYIAMIDKLDKVYESYSI